MASTRTPEQRANMSAAQKRRYARIRTNGASRKALMISKVIQANQLCLQLLDLVDIETASALLKSLERKTNA